MGREEPISWSAYSLDLTLLDFFFCRILKYMVNQEMPNTSEIYVGISPEMIMCSTQDLAIKRLELCFEVSSEYFEHFL